MPAACRLSAAVRPPMPAPITVTFMIAPQRSNAFRAYAQSRCARPVPLVGPGLVGLVERNLSAPDNFGPTFGFGSEAGDELISRLGGDVHAEGCVLITYGRTANCFDDGVVEALKGRFRSVGGSSNRPPV